MTRLARLALLCLASVAALAAAGCGNKEEIVTVAETEGIYVTVDDLKYQIQISRILNPSSPEDSAYLRGVPEDEAEPANDEVWFGIFLRVENETGEPLTPAEHFEIVDNPDGTRTYYLAADDIHRGIDVVSWTGRPNPIGSFAPAGSSTTTAMNVGLLGLAALLLPAAAAIGRRRRRVA